MKRVITILTIIVFAVCVAGQSLSNVWEFLELPAGARNGALGGFGIAVCDSDLSLSFDNPAHLGKTTDRTLALNYQNRFRDVNIASAAYGYNPSDKDFMAFGMRYVDYGKFDGRSVTDAEEGRFTAKDMVANVTYARWFSPHLSAGVAAKVIYSVYEKYQSVGMAFDFGFSYHNAEKGVTAALVLRNAGFQIKGLYSIESKQHTETLPLNLMVGVSYKLSKAPLRFSFTYHNLERWDLNYTSTDVVKDVMANKSKGLQGLDMFFRHTIWSVEVIPTSYLRFVVSYNHQAHRDMAVSDHRSIAGFAFGAGFSVKMVSVDFSITPYQAGNICYNASVAIKI
ncbi:MAG: type IX secretion system protein PorQ [Paludibacteraceae bacterium]|nr:type IX secretion system protein PorQ [Paludibacteraceae bacterium]